MSAAPGPVLPDLKRPARGKPGARLVSVAASRRITPNMIRLTLTGPDLADVRNGCEGANCKILLPEAGQTREGFAHQIKQGPRPVTRTYTVRHWRPEVLELDVDFVDHGTEGPASAFANRAVPGDFCGFAGPGPVKLAGLTADWYLVAADMSALPVAAATLEAMPRDARGVAIFEVTDPADRQQIDAPEGIVQHWLPHPDPHRPSQAQETLIRALDWPKDPDVRVQTCIAGESAVIKSLRAYLHQDRGLPRKDTYISGYWKIGLVEDEHQVEKRRDNA
ncbi:MAG: siderophore-interacting protein [Pseudodonghicola sp.]|nr:siderophore-interacting protein [Pseudodonghicola sp.]